jgi:3-hydroxybutyrate dehydrogenase
MLELPLDPVADTRPRAEGTKSLSGKVAQIGATALFLCSPAAAQIRGIALPVDGGWTAQ